MKNSKGFTIIQTIVTVAIVATIASFAASMARDAVVRQRGLAESSKIMALEEAKRLWAYENTSGVLDGEMETDLEKAFYAYGQLRPYLKTPSGEPAPEWASISYSPYGERTIESGSVSTPFCFVGRFGVLTESNGNLAMMARFYSPSIRRFLSEDPIGFEGGLNLYAYVSNNPVNLIDPLGLSEAAAMAWLSKLFTYGGNPHRDVSYKGQALVEDVAKPYCEGMAQGAAIVGTVAVGSALSTAAPAVPALTRTALLFPLRYPKETSATLMFLDQRIRSQGAQPPLLGPVYDLFQGGAGDSFLGPGFLRWKQFSGSQNNQSKTVTRDK